MIGAHRIVSVVVNDFERFCCALDGFQNQPYDRRTSLTIIAPVKCCRRKMSTLFSGNINFSSIELNSVNVGLHTRCIFKYGYDKVNGVYMGRELAKRYRGHDRMVAIDSVRSEEIRPHDEANRDANQIQLSEYGGGRMQNYHIQTDSQLAAEGIARKISSSLSNWRIEDLLGGQSMLNADSIQNAQAWITNDNSLSPAQVVRARELLQELLITITTKPDGRNVPAAMRRSIYIAESSFPEDTPSNFVAGRRISDYTSSRSFSQHNTQSPLRSDTSVLGRELPVIQNSLPLSVPLTLSAQNWRDDSITLYSDSGQMPMSSREISKNPDFRCGLRNEYPTPRVENAELIGSNARKHDAILLGSEKRRPHYQDRRRISRSRSRSLEQDCDTGIGERRVHMKSRGFISVEINHPQKASRRNYLSYEINRSRHRENRDDRSLRRSSSLTRAVGRHRR
ncbi:unnamed protein product [Cercopithifilaria johnstoni]|uniref:Uncharacterized protein n=1 Tax=Cercopithifilaria johnstoni TaxID=2874296 RepID=A0A8J2M6K4_9BILA|nr:unnamed protein product [Cercopithifilaria johnstoni]